jgi:putative PEP-CTERM system TPR-repeat lipoprotein
MGLRQFQAHDGREDLKLRKEVPRIEKWLSAEILVPFRRRREFRHRPATFSSFDRLHNRRGNILRDCVALISSKRWRLAAIGAAIAGSLSLSQPAFCDVPPASYTQGKSGAAAAAAVEKLLADARKALANGNVRLALIYLKNAVSTAPGNATARLELGKALLLADDTFNAELQLRQARKDGAPPSQLLPFLFQAMLSRNESQFLLDQFPDPGSSANTAAADILKGRALALQKLKRQKEALEAIDRSLALRRDASGMLTKARMSLQQGDFAGAARLADEAIRDFPDDSDAMLFKVELYLLARDSSAALDLANQMTAKFPASLAGRFARVEAYLRLKQDAKAKAEIDSMLAEKPGMFMAVYYRALLMARAGDFKGAWGLAQTLPADFLDADQGMAAMVAQMALSAGDVETGASMLTRMLKDHPEQFETRVRLASLRVQQDAVGSALNVLRPVLDSNDPRVARLLAVIYLRTNRPAQAMDALKKLDAGGRGNATVKRSIGLLELHAGNTDQAITEFSQAAALEPTNPAIVAPLVDLLIKQRRYPEALKVADRLGADPKQRGEALVYRGTILMLERDVAGARLALDKAVALNPRSKTALFSRATLLELTQKYSDAGRDLKAILDIDNKDAAATAKLANIAIRQGDDDNSRSLLSQAISLSPRNTTPRIALTRYLISRGDMKGALAAANGCLGVQPDNSDCVLLLGKIQSTLGQKKEAAASFRRLVSLQPNDASARLMLSAALTLAGDRVGAGRALDAAAELAPPSAEVKRAQISFQLGQGNAEAAVAMARTFQASYPGLASDMLLAETLQRTKRNDEAEAVLGKSLTERPSSPVLMRLVQLALFSNDRRRAGDLMSAWLAKNPGDGPVRMEYAAFQLQQGDTAKAVSQYQMVLKRDPNNVDALNNLGWLIQGKDPKQAGVLLARAWKLSPNAANVADTFGWFKLQQKDAAGALALLDRAHALQPGDGEITYHLAVALDANAKRDEARKLLKALLASGAKFKDRDAAVQLSSRWQ